MQKEKEKKYDHAPAMAASGGVYRLSLLLFVLAGATGALFRFGEMTGVWFGLNPSHIRHAHSHLMFFAWAVPLPISLLIAEIQGRSGRFHRARWIPWILIFTALSTYPFFLRYGYDPVRFGLKRIPLSVIFASLNMLVWYSFIYVYIRGRKYLVANLARSFSDLAVLFLFLSTLGAWGLAFVKILKISDEFISQALMHLFVNYFAEGWLVPVLFSLLLQQSEKYGDPSHHATRDLASVRTMRGRRAVYSVSFGLPFVFIEGIPRHMLPPGYAFWNGVGALLLGAGMLYHIVLMFRSSRGGFRFIAGIPLSFLLFKYSGLLLSVFLPSLPWEGFRILYIHVMLLGFASAIVVLLGESLTNQAAGIVDKKQIPEEGGRTGSGSDRGEFRAGIQFRILSFQLAVLIMVLTLVLVTPLWPRDWSGQWIFTGLFLGAISPPAVALLMLARAMRTLYGGKHNDKSGSLLRVLR